MIDEINGDKLVKKLGGNWHQVQIWKEWVIGYKSGGIVMVLSDSPEVNEMYIPFYSFAGFTISNDALLVQSTNRQLFRMNLRCPEKLEKVGVASDDLMMTQPDLLVRECNERAPDNEPTAEETDNRFIVKAYSQTGIDFFCAETGEKIGHFDFPGYSFIDSVKLHNQRLYVADVFGLRILDISDIKNIRLDDRFTVHKGWPKDAALYRQYLIVADVLGVKIYDRENHFSLTGKFESNRNRVAKAVVGGDYAFLSCEAMGLKVVDLSDPGNPRLTGGVVLPAGVWDCALYGSHAYLAAYTGGLLKVDCSNIKNLEQVASHHEDGEIIGVSVNDRAVFAACSHNGFAIFDHSLRRISGEKNIPGRCWTVLEQEDILMIAAGREGVWIYDLSDLSRPRLIHRIQTIEARDLCIRDRRLFIADGQNGALIYSLDDIRAPQPVGRIPSAAFTRGILADDHYLYKTDGDGGVEIYERQ